jgi:hypothetical protein
MRCGFQWPASYLMATGHTLSIWEKCVLDKHHDGDHMSMFKVTAPNDKDKLGKK